MQRPGLRPAAILLALAAAGLVIGGSLNAGEHPKSDAWTDLTSPDHWRSTDGWVFEGDVIAMPKKGAGWLWSEAKYEDFILSLEVKTTGNSGIFFRTAPNNPVHGGFEFQVLRPSEKDDPGRHDFGALYDIKAPQTNASKPGWNEVWLKCEGSILHAKLNGETVWRVDISRWTTPRRNPDGSKNKFKNALAELPRNNHIGFQDHGHPVAYRNVRIKRLADKP